MKPFSAMIVLTGAITVWSDTIGDFAPLTAGNLWIYEDVTSSGMMSVGISTDSTVISMLLKESVKTGDTIRHYFDITQNYTHTFSHAKTRADTTVESSRSSSTDPVLKEVGNSIIQQGTWPDFSPVFRSHELAADDSMFLTTYEYGARCTLQVVDGKYTLYIYRPDAMVSGMSVGSFTYTYRQDTGFVQYSFSKYSSSGVSAATHHRIRLRSFSAASTGKTVQIPAPETGISRIRFDTMKEFGFRGLLLSNGTTRFNLLGRVDHRMGGMHQRELWNCRIKCEDGPDAR